MSEQPLFDVQQLKKLNPRLGDVFVLEVPDDTDSDQMEILGCQFAQQFNGAKVLMKPKNLELFPLRIVNENDLPVDGYLTIDENGMRLTLTKVALPPDVRLASLLSRIDEHLDCNGLTLTKRWNRETLRLRGEIVAAIGELQAQAPASPTPSLFGYPFSVTDELAGVSDVPAQGGDSDVAALQEAAGEAPQATRFVGGPVDGESVSTPAASWITLSISTGRHESIMVQYEYSCIDGNYHYVQPPALHENKVSTIKPEPGDVLVVELSEVYNQMDEAELNRVGAEVGKRFDGVKVLALPPGATLTKHTPKKDEDVFVLHLSGNYAPLDNRYAERIRQSLSADFHGANVVVCQPGVTLTKQEAAGAAPQATNAEAGSPHGGYVGVCGVQDCPHCKMLPADEKDWEAECANRAKCELSGLTQFDKELLEGVYQSQQKETESEHPQTWRDRPPML